ncbi:MAG: HAD family phosphatase [Chlamydiae bacterium]|nr:HAD family phosphatase [Chlamydiota bacterium]
MNIKALLIDMDGVLVISEQKHFIAWQKVLDTYKILHTNFEYQDVVGVADNDIAKMFIDRFSLPITVEELCNLKKEFFIDSMVEGIHSPKGRDRFLKEAKNKYLLAVVSSSSRREIEAVLKRENILNYFSFFIGAEDTHRHKPFPDPYLLALEKTKLSSMEAIAIEDSPSGIKAALKANVKVLAISSYMNSYSDDLQVKFYKDFNEVREVLL